MSGSPSPVSIAPSVIRKLVIATAIAVVLVTVSLGLAMHRGPSSPSVAAAATTSGTVKPATTSQYLDDDATADLGEVGCEMVADHIPTGSSLGCQDDR